MPVTALPRMALLLAALLPGPAPAQLSGQGSTALSGALASAQSRHAQRYAGRPLNAAALLIPFYASMDNQLVWGGPASARSRQALALLGQADDAGLVAEDYVAALALPAASAPGEAQLAAFDVTLSGAVLQLLADLHAGRSKAELANFADLPAPVRFDPGAQLRLALQAERLDQAVEDAQPRLPLYARVRQALVRYRQLARSAPAFAALPAPGPGPLRPGMPYAGAAALGQRLALLGDLPDASGVDPAPIYSEALAAGVRHFQQRHGLADDGVPGPATMAALAVPLSGRARQLALTLERLRAIPALPPGPLVVVNVPAFRLWAWDTQETLGMRVIVGAAGRTPTPLLISQIDYLEFQPYWNVPSSIMRADIMPALRRDPRYLERHDMELVALAGHGAASSPLAALQAGTARVRQRPGPANVLGAVKFGMRNHLQIYLHSTAAKQLFGKARRDLSHGCIRVEQPEQLAQFVLAGQAGWDRGSVAAAMQSGPNRTVRLTRPVPVILAYATAIVERSGTVLFSDDLYQHDRKLAATLKLRAP